MVETICTPYGKAAFPTVVKCDGCGEVIDGCGWFRFEPLAESGPGSAGYRYDDNEHYCDECADKLEHRGEFRICDRCGSVMTEGFCDEEADHICEECFEDWMHESFPAGWRAVEDDGCGGYYEWYEPREQEWCGTGIYWTEWR